MNIAAWITIGGIVLKVLAWLSKHGKRGVVDDVIKFLDGFKDTDDCLGIKNEKIKFGTVADVKTWMAQWADDQKVAALVVSDLDDIGDVLGALTSKDSK